jgi:hypothetical protein
MPTQSASSDILPDIDTVPLGHVRLILLSPNESRPSFHLQIFIATILLLCLKLVKYLRYLGWSILGVVRVVKLGDTEVKQDEHLQDEETYHYYVPGNEGSSFCAAMVQNSIADIK